MLNLTVEKTSKKYTHILPNCMAATAGGMQPFCNFFLYWDVAEENEQQQKCRVPLYWDSSFDVYVCFWECMIVWVRATSSSLSSPTPSACRYVASSDKFFLLFFWAAHFIWFHFVFISFKPVLSSHRFCVFSFVVEADGVWKGTTMHIDRERDREREGKWEIEWVMLHWQIA